jgi:hypothetical protein
VADFTPRPPNPRLVTLVLIECKAGWVPEAVLGTREISWPYLDSNPTLVEPIAWSLYGLRYPVYLFSDILFFYDLNIYH